MYADAVVTVVLRAESDPMPQKSEQLKIIHLIYIMSNCFLWHFISKEQ